jgi:cellulose synthase/poly-beta-1,6-N-acetylglucosamine synthase-like glycosyltransferase
MIIVLGIIAIVSFLLFIHPYLTYPLSLLFMRRREVAMGDAPVSFSLLFSAYNEEAALPAKIANLRELKQRYPELQILAYCDLSTDRTLDLLREASDVVEVIAATQRTGKATGMGRLVKRARGDVCIFTDANVILDPSSVNVLERYFGNPQIGGVAGSLKYINDAESATARAGGLYWRLEEAIKALESRTGSIMGADGSIFAIRRDLYPEVPPHLLDDMITSMAAPINLKRLVFATDVVAYEKNATSSADEFRRKRRIACRAFNTHRFLWPLIRERFDAVDLYKYLSHKLIRWFGLIPLITFALSAGAILLMTGESVILFGLVVLCIAGFLLGRARVSPFSVITQILLAVIATLVGIIDSTKGLTYQTWTPAQSRN